MRGAITRGMKCEARKADFTSHKCKDTAIKMVIISFYCLSSGFLWFALWNGSLETHACSLIVFPSDNKQRKHFHTGKRLKFIQLLWVMEIPSTALFLAAKYNIRIDKNLDVNGSPFNSLVMQPVGHTLFFKCYSIF